MGTERPAERGAGVLRHGVIVANEALDSESGGSGDSAEAPAWPRGVTQAGPAPVNWTPLSLPLRHTRRAQQKSSSSTRVSCDEEKEPDEGESQTPL